MFFIVIIVDDVLVIVVNYVLVIVVNDVLVNVINVVVVVAQPPNIWLTSLENPFLESDKAGNRLLPLCFFFLVFLPEMTSVANLINDLWSYNSTLASYYRHFPVTTMLGVCFYKIAHRLHLHFWNTSIFGGGGQCHRKGMSSGGQCYKQNAWLMILWAIFCKYPMPLKIAQTVL